MIETAAIARFGLLLVRPGMLVIATPFFGGLHVPVPIRIGLGVMLALVLAPVVPVPARLESIGLALTVAGEVAIGLALAMGVRLVVAGAELAGHLAGFQIGLSYAAVVDPQSGVRNNIVAALYANLALLALFGLNAHHAFIRSLAASYTVVPIGLAALSGSGIDTVSTMLGLVFATGVRLSAPVVGVLLLVELALGLLARAAPALNMMVIGTPIRLTAGLAALVAGVQVVPGVIANTAPAMYNAAQHLLRAFR